MAEQDLPVQHVDQSKTTLGRNHTRRDETFTMQRQDHYLPRRLLIIELGACVLDFVWYCLAQTLLA